MLGVSMRVTRVDYPNGAYELRDSLDQRWQTFLKATLPGEIFLPIPNIGPDLKEFLDSLQFDGFILSGGEDWGVFPERDMTEKAIFDYASQHGLPIIGVCRGAQVLNMLYGGKLASAFGKNHAATRHELLCGEALQSICGHIREVNSYHGNVIMPDDLALGLEPLASAPDGSIEAFSTADARILGIMWHPEREAQPCVHDLALFRHFLGRRGV